MRYLFNLLPIMKHKPPGTYIIFFEIPRTSESALYLRGGGDRLALYFTPRIFGQTWKGFLRPIFTPALHTDIERRNQRHFPQNWETDVHDFFETRNYSHRISLTRSSHANMVLPIHGKEKIGKQKAKMKLKTSCQQKTCLI